MSVDVQGQKITVEQLEIERRLLIISTDGFAADESHDQLRGDVSLEQVALTVAVLSFRQGSDLEGRTDTWPSRWPIVYCGPSTLRHWVSEDTA